MNDALLKAGLQMDVQVCFSELRSLCICVHVPIAT